MSISNRPAAVSNGDPGVALPAAPSARPDHRCGWPGQPDAAAHHDAQPEHWRWTRVGGSRGTAQEAWRQGATRVPGHTRTCGRRSEERRVGKECRSRWTEGAIKKGRYLIEMTTMIV